MPVLAIVHDADTGPGVFVEAIRDHGSEMAAWRPPEGEPPPGDVLDYDAVIVCGGAAHPDQGQAHQWMAREQAVIVELVQHRVPVLGLCLGAQLLAKALGAPVGRVAEPEIGWYQVQATDAGRHDPLIGPLGPEFVALEWHSYEFALPAVATPLAYSDRCLQAFRAGEHTWGIQFHAEVTADDFGSWIDTYGGDPDAVAIDLDPGALRAETEQRIAGWNDLGRKLCARFLAATLSGLKTRGQPAPWCARVGRRLTNRRREMSKAGAFRWLASVTRGPIGAMTLALAASALIVAGCGSSSSSSSTTSSSSSAASTSSAATAPTISATSFTNNFSAMATLKSLAAQGKGKIAAILPDTTSSTRYVEFDAPDLKAAAAAAGLPVSDMIVQNALGSDSTFVTDAESDITNGASVLLIDAEDSGTGVTVQRYAKAHGVEVIDYDRLTLGAPKGTADYVSFNNVEVGQLIGKGFVSCVNAWHVSKPQVVVMRGAVTDNNATLFADGYNGVLKSDFSSGKYKLVATPAGTWTPSVALTEFEGAYTAHPNINAAVIPNDENGAPIISYLQSHGVKAKTFPTTGQDATLTGLQNVLAGFQCGTVYKPIYLEAQAAISLALYLRAGQSAPASLLNATTTDPTTKLAVPSVYLAPEWVTPTNMNDTIVKDKFVPTAQLCAGKFAADCKAAGIS